MRVLLLLAVWTLTKSPMRTNAAFVYVPSSAAKIAALPRASCVVMSIKPCSVGFSGPSLVLLPRNRCTLLHSMAVLQD